MKSITILRSSPPSFKQTQTFAATLMYLRTPRWFIFASARWAEASPAEGRETLAGLDFRCNQKRWQDEAMNIMFQSFCDFELHERLAWFSRPVYSGAGLHRCLVLFVCACGLFLSIISTFTIYTHTHIYIYMYVYIYIYNWLVVWNVFYFSICRE